MLQLGTLIDPPAGAPRTRRRTATRPAVRSRRIGRWTCVLAVAAAACTPTYNWREVRPAGPMLALLPCKPERITRSVPLAGRRVPMTVAACEAGGLNWGLGVVDVGDAAQAGAALAGLERALADNLGGRLEGEGPVRVGGQTPWPQSRQVRIDGRDPEGRPLWARSWVYARGSWVAQATVLGRTPPTAAQREPLESFAAGLRIAP